MEQNSERIRYLIRYSSKTHIIFAINDYEENIAPCLHIVFDFE